MVKVNQIIYKTNKDGKLFQYEVIDINHTSKIVKIKSFSSGYIRTTHLSELSSYKTVIPKYKEIASIIDSETIPSPIIN